MSIVKKIPWKKWSPPSDFPCQMPSIEDEKRPSQAICLDSLWTIHHPWPDRFFGPERGEILCRDPVGMCLGAAENFYGPFWHSEPKYASDVNSFFNSYVNFKHNVSGAELLKLYRIGFFFDFDFDHHLAGISHLNSREDVKQIINYAVGRPVNSPVHIDDRYMRCRNFHHHPKIPVSILENPIAFIVRVLNIVGATTEISCSGHNQKDARISFFDTRSRAWARYVTKKVGLGFFGWSALFISQEDLKNNAAFFAAESIYLNRLWFRNIKMRGLW